MAKRQRYKSYSWTHPKTGKLYARVQIRQPDGSTKTILKPAMNKTHVRQLADEILTDFEQRKGGMIAGETMTFADLAKWYKEKHSIPPVYSDDGTKIAGIRTYKNEARRIDKLIEFFSKTPIKVLDDTALLRYKLKREKEVQSAAINRDFEILRAMFRKAVRRRWLKESPFDFGEKLIEKSREKRRDVVISVEQENKILHFARNADKSFIYHVVLCLIDTGARPSEIYDASTEKAAPVRWKDFFDFDFKAVRLTSYKGTQIHVRFAPVSARLELAMRELWESQTIKDFDLQIFNIKSLKTAWKTVCKKADIQNVRLRDLRRSFSTKLANLGIENDVRQRILGHEQAQTTFDYTSINLDTALSIRLKMELSGLQDISDQIN